MHASEVLFYRLQKAVNNYAVMISEEDGDVDMDLPRKKKSYV